MSRSPEKTLSRLATALALFYCVLLLIALFMPLQVDEVEYMLWNHRAWVDNKHIIGIFPQCGAQIFSQALPLIWYLPAYFDTFTYARIDSLLGIRIFGIFQFFIWLFLFFAIAVRLFNVPRGKFIVIAAIILAFLGLDALPLALQVNRPEQILLIDAALFVAAALYADHFSRTLALRIFSTLLLFFVAMCAHSAHLKSFALIPLEIVMAAVFFERAWKSRIATFAGTGLLLWISLQSYAVYVARFECSHYPMVEKFLHTQYLPLETMWKAPFLFLSEAALKLFSSFLLALNLHSHLAFSNGWIPLSLRPLNPLMDLMVDVADFAAWLIYIFFLLGACYVAWAKIIRPWKNNPQRKILQLSFDSIASSGLLAVLLGIAVFFVFSAKAYYSVSFAVPLLGLGALFALRLSSGPDLLEHPSFPRYAIPLVMLAIANQGLLAYRYGPFVSEPQHYETVIPHRLMTMAAWGAENSKPAILELASQCHIPASGGNHITLDDVAYMVFRDSHEPITLEYSTWINQPFDAREYFRLLASYGSDGVIGDCRNFPPKLRKFAKEYQGYCCIPKSTIDSENH